MSDIAIKVENVSKIYPLYQSHRDRLKEALHPFRKKYHHDFYALNDVSFEVKKGETVGIIGRNGSGKSTLLSIIAGVLHPSSGSVTVNGRISSLLELGAGFNPELTGIENVYFYGMISGFTKEEMDEKIENILSFAEIGEFIEQPVKTYSSGMAVRLAFSVIAHLDADTLVVDEALAVGDAFFTQKCMRFIRNFQSTGGTLLFVSHDTGAVVNLCSRAILLKSGRLIQSGGAKEISEQYLSMIYESNQAVDGVERNIHSSDTYKEEADEYVDVRQSLINNSTLRNDIEIFQFNLDSTGFGAGGAKIQSARLLDSNGKSLSWVVGGENVILEICCVANIELSRPIIGFSFKDRLGQIIFEDNTYLTYRLNPQAISPGDELVASFSFRFPILPTGDYSFAVAIADGSQDNHVQHHWIHDALMIKVHASSICFGLVGIPMKNIKLTKKIGVGNE